MNVNNIKKLTDLSEIEMNEYEMSTLDCVEENIEVIKQLKNSEELLHALQVITHLLIESDKLYHKSSKLSQLFRLEHRLLLVQFS